MHGIASDHKLKFNTYGIRFAKFVPSQMVPHNLDTNPSLIRLA